MKAKQRLLGAALGLPLVLAGTFAALFNAGLGQWMATWGATVVETSVPLPGDEVLPTATNLSTKAITIRATPDEVWPWLAQMGIGRAGMYSYDWIERVIGSGDFVDGHSADRIHPELQSREVGDKMVLHPPTNLTYTVAAVKSPRLIVYRGTSIGDATWTFYLAPGDEGTRLITRWRGSAPRGLGDEVANAISGTMDFVMEQRMLRGIKERVELQLKDHR
jgi:hypothetical protein